MRLPRLLAGGAAVAVLTGTAACGLPALEPKLELRAAAQAFSAGTTGNVELSVASSADEVRAFAEAAQTSSGDGVDVTDGDLAAILSSSLEYGYDLGDDREDTTDDAARLALRIGDLDAGEFLAVGDLAYARADLDGLAEQFPDMQEDLDTFRAAINGDEGTSAPASLVEPATALLDGGWISFDPQAYLEAIQGGQADMGLTEEAAAELRDLVGSALKDAVVGVERRETDEELGDHLVAKVDLRTAYAPLRSGLPDLFTGAMADSLRESLPPVTDAPARQIEVSFWVLDNTLNRVEIDIAQFLDEPAGHLVLRADARPGTEIIPPSDAVEFDAEAFAEEITATPPSAPLDAYTVATWVDEDIAIMADEIGIPPSVDLLSEVHDYYTDIEKSLRIGAVGGRIQVTLFHESVCLTLSPDGYGEDIVDGPC